MAQHDMDSAALREAHEQANGDLPLTASDTLNIVRHRLAKLDGHVGVPNTFGGYDYGTNLGSCRLRLALDDNRISLFTFDRFGITEATIHFENAPVAAVLAAARACL